MRLREPGRSFTDAGQLEPRIQVILYLGKSFLHGGQGEKMSEDPHNQPVRGLCHGDVVVL